MTYQSYLDDSVSLDHGSLFLADHLSRYQWIKDLVKDKTVLDCACGKGYGSYLISLTAKKTVGIDLNKNSLEIARTRFSRANLSYLDTDVLSLTRQFPEKSFDVIVAFEIIEHIPPETTGLFLNEVAKTLKSGGMLILSTPNHDVVTKSGVSVPDFHINNFKPTELRKALRARFKKVELLGQFTPRKPVNHLLFSLDFLNLRHSIRSLLTGPKIFTEENQSGSSFPSVDSKFLDQYLLEKNSYHFSSKHWRQAGLTMAIAREAIGE